MKVLLVGSGGREHAIAWKLSQSPNLDKLFIAPGNAGMATLGELVSIGAEDIDSLLAFAKAQSIDFAVIGPEGPLALGLSDRLREAGIPAFGPSQAAARLEYSKAFAKDFMTRHGIPTARYKTFNDYSEAVRHIREVDYSVVVKASGLAAGKGVIVSGDKEEAERAVRKVMMDRAFGESGNTCVLEEKLEGEEVSLLGFSDGKTIRVMPPAQDHKRVFDGDQGPNTGGMGAYAPAPICPPDKRDAWALSILQKTVDGMREEGNPYRGVLYAGLMVTPQGPFVIEFNCRFGDPEVQALLPLLDSDLLDIFVACEAGNVGETTIRWKPGAAACVVLASGGYPEKYATGLEITGLDEPLRDAVIFHAGTKFSPDKKVVTAGGRVLCVTGMGSSIANALHSAYSALECIHFDGMHYRKDIGRRAFRE